MTDFFKSNALERSRGGLSGTPRDSAYKAVKEYFVETMPKPVHRALGAALRNLYDGPSGSGMGFESALRVLTEWWNSTEQEIWYESWSGEILTSEPKPYKISCDEEDPDCDANGERTIEPNLDDYTHFDSSAVKTIVFGRELAPFIR